MTSRSITVLTVPCRGAGGLLQVAGRSVGEHDPGGDGQVRAGRAFLAAPTGQPRPRPVVTPRSQQLLVSRIVRNVAAGADITLDRPVAPNPAGAYDEARPPLISGR